MSVPKSISRCETSRCGLCRFYNHEGRRGGYCTQLNVPVDSHWKACCLAVSPFQSAPQDGVGIAEWSLAKKQVPSPVFAVGSGIDSALNSTLNSMVTSA